MNVDKQKSSLTLSWRNVSAWTKPNKFKANEKKKLLHNVSGIARSGYLTTILGPSGAGKTTLLAALSKRYKDCLEGEILLNGQEINQEQMSNVSGFVCQKDPVFEELTVAEHMFFTARLKMDKNLSEFSRSKIVSAVVENLLLSHRMNVQIRSLSGGQRKRLSLAAQLLTGPRILFCDEPTSGLDSFSAVSVVKLLRSLLDEGKMIICAVHQPTSGIFELFDEVTLLASGGAMAYHGPVSEVLNYFSSLGMNCPENYNTSDFVISQITVRPPSCGSSEKDEETVHKLICSFQESVIYEKLKNELNEASENKNFVSTKSRISHVPFHIEFAWLIWRSALQISRQYKMWLFRFFAYLFVFSCLALPYGTIHMDQIGVQNTQGFMHCLVLEILYSSLYGVSHSIPDDLPVFIQESADKLYSPHSYYFSKLIILSTKGLIETCIYTNYALAVTGLNRNFNDYILCALPLILISLVSSAYGFFLSTTFESVTTFSLFSVPFELICQALGGLIVKLRSLPPATAWLKYISFVFYAYEALAIQQWTKYKHIHCNTLNINDCRYLSGNDVLTSFDFSPSDILMDYLGLLGYFVVLHSLSFFFLLRKLKRSTAY